MRPRCLRLQNNLPERKRIGHQAQRALKGSKGELQVPAVALLELLAAAAGAGIVAAGQFLHTDGLHGLAVAGIAGCSLLLGGIRHLASRLLVLWPALLRCGLLARRLGLYIQFGNHN